MSLANKKFTTGFAWLFALGAIVVGILVTLILNPVKPGAWKVIFGVIAVASAAGGFAGTKLTPAGVGGVVGRFALAGVVVAATYFAYAKHMTGKMKGEDAGVLVANAITGGLDLLMGTVGGLIVIPLLMVIGGLVGALVGRGGAAALKGVSIG